jgi:hypothetical protein
LEFVLLPPCDTLTPPVDTLPTDSIPTDTIPTDTIPTDTIPGDSMGPPTVGTILPMGGSLHGGGNWGGHRDRHHRDSCQPHRRHHRHHWDHFFHDSIGFIKLRQPADTELIVFLNAFFRRLTPNNVYLLQVAADTVVNGTCEGEDWTTVGPGILTNERGKGRTSVSQDLSAVPVGTVFDLHFQLVDSVTSYVVLESKCRRFTTRQ